MTAEYASDIAEITAGDEYGRNIVSLYNPLNYIGAEAVQNAKHSVRPPCAWDTDHHNAGKSARIPLVSGAQQYEGKYQFFFSVEENNPD